MRLNLDANIVRHMHDGLIVLDHHAQIASFNRPAERWVTRCREMAPAFKRLIDEERKGRLTLPAHIDLQINSLIPSRNLTEAWLCKNGRNEYAIFVVSQPGSVVACALPAPAPKRQFQQLALIGGEVRDQLARVRNLLESVPTKAAPPLVQQCRVAERLMQEVADLSLLQDCDQVFCDERLSIPDIVENILASLPAEAKHSVVELRTDTELTGPVYGNSAWLSYALRLLIMSLINSTPPGATVEIRTHQMGDFLVLTGRANGNRFEAVAPPSTPAETDLVQASTLLESSIQMMICKRIIELHAGQLRCITLPSPDTESSASGIESFTLTLMTGLPEHERSRVSCQGCRHVQQELAYAQDIAQLLSDTRTINHK